MLMEKKQEDYDTGMQFRALETVKLPPIWNEMRLREELCDTCISLNNQKRIWTHRVILSAVSSYFKAYFTYNKDRKDNVIKLDVSEDVLNSILDFAYTGTCQVQWCNVENLLIAADRFEVMGVIQICCEFLAKKLNVENCIGIYVFAKNFFCKDLSNCAMKYILNNFSEVVSESEELVNLSPEELTDILSNDYLNVNTEETVFNAIKKWIEFDVGGRFINLKSLLKCLRFDFFDFTKIQKRLINWSVIMNNPESQQIVIPLCTKSRIPSEVILVFGGWANTPQAPTNSVEVLDTRAHVWLRLRCPDSRRAYHGVCTVDQKIYVFGGYDGSKLFNSMRRFDPITYKWEEKACMHQVRCYVSVALQDKMIYAIGGYDGSSRLNSVERYHLEKNQWELIAPMWYNRSDAGATASGDYVYVVGGCDNMQILDTCEMYSPKTNNWTVIPFMHSPRSGVGLVACNEDLFAIGGFDGHTRLSSVERFSLKEKKWSLTARMMLPRSNFASVVFEGMIYVFGGFNGNQITNLVERFDQKIGKWCHCPPMNDNRSGISACLLDKIPNIKQYSVHFHEMDGEGPCAFNENVSDEMYDILEFEPEM